MTTSDIASALKWSLVAVGGVLIAREAIKMYRASRRMDDRRGTRARIDGRERYPTLRRDPVSGEFRVI